ncbi:unnamed protein product [Clavelina lepadiformis]|uniref:Claudin n=1 Tax=Clavelina lepadiformis TaxID=159417 RepID=A0ABP0F0D7_CLALP
MKYVEIAGLGCGFFGAAGSLWCLLDPCWKTTSQDLTVQPYDVCYGIWEGCLLPSDGSWVCDGYFGKTIIDQHVKARQHYCRAGAICAIILMSLATLIGGLGSECCKIRSFSLESKPRLCTAASLMFCVGGILVGSAGLWYLTEIYLDRINYFLSEAPGLGYTLGRAIYIALTSGFLGIVAAVCFGCFSLNGYCVRNEPSVFHHSSGSKGRTVIRHGYRPNDDRQRKFSPNRNTEYV